MSTFDLKKVRDRIARNQGQDFWRGLEELAETPEFKAFLHQEFPPLAGFWETPIDRRSLLKLMGASLALAGMTGCGRMPGGELVPYVNRPEQAIPGRPLYFATTLSPTDFGQGVVVESHTGRPTFIEGNPQHPASLGAMDPWLQASVLELYDPDRSPGVYQNNRLSTWDAFRQLLQNLQPALRQRQGDGVRLLTPAVTSPSLTQQIRALLDTYPNAVWHQHSPIDRETVIAGAELAFGQRVETHYDLGQAAVILALDADFLGSQPGHLRYARDFAAGRRIRDGSAKMNRLYVIESTPSITGAAADHWRTVRTSAIASVAHALAQRLGLVVDTGAVQPPISAQWLDALVRDLQRHRGKSVIIAGDSQPAPVHALAQAMNHTLGNSGKTVFHSEPIAAPGAATLEELVQAIQQQRVNVLVMLDCNPVYDAPANLAFAERLKAVPLRIHAGLYRDETAHQCQWHLNMAHPLESWGDARAFDGTLSLMQPLIAPLQDGKTPGEIIALLQDADKNPDAYAQVRAYWRNRYTGFDFATWWQTALREGVIADTAAPPKRVTLRQDMGQAIGPPSATQPGLELQFRPDPAVWDGRFANNGWLQELPRPLTKLTWDNAALLAPATAERLGLGNGDIVELSHQDKRLRIPIWLLPGQPPDAITVSLGYGRSHAGQLGNGVGANAYRLRDSRSPWFLTGIELQKTGAHHDFATTQLHHSMEGRDFVRTATLDTFRQNPHFASKPPAEQSLASLYPPHSDSDHAWGMVIDLTACIGCNACISACQNENNTPIVGKREVARGRAMHWLRVDRYYQGHVEAPATYFEPVLCMQCELAPCEYVCPVGATVHDSEGLNAMVYNRCIGTRFCSQNCPYKVRRFNWFDYMGENAATPKAVNNPDVTVRARGVMEKCTYCIQRISAARIQANREQRKLKPNEVRTACQAACPTQAIVFGDLHEKDSEVVRLKQTPLNYGLLEELNTRPRTTYLAQVSNPNPEIEK